MENPDVLPWLLSASLLLLISWLVWRRHSTTPMAADAALHRAPTTLAGIQQFAAAAKAAEARRRQVLRDGLPAPASILSVEETGVAEHDWDEDDDEPFDRTQTRPQVRVRLLIQPTGAVPYEAETTEFLTREKLIDLQPGQTVGVRYAADEPTRVALER